MKSADTEEKPMPLIDLSTTPHPLVEADRRAGEIVSHVMGGVSRMLHEHMSLVKLELRAITNDNSQLRENLSRLNHAMGEFQLRQVIPLRELLETLRTEQGSTVIENQRKLEALIQALTRTLQAAGTLIPDDLKASIQGGRFEDADHEIANDGMSEVPGYIPVERVSAMIDAAVAVALSKRQG